MSTVVRFSAPSWVRGVARAVIVVAVLAAAAMVLPAGVSSQEEARAQTAVASECQRVPLDPKPGWTNSAMWAPGGTDLLVVDPLYREVFGYSRDGHSTGSLPRALQQNLGRLSALELERGGPGMVMRLPKGRFVGLDESFRPTDALDLRRDTTGGDREVHLLWQWAPAGKDIVAYGDIGPVGEPAQRSAFLRFPLGDPSSVTVFDYPAGVGSSASIFYRIGHEYIGSLGSQGLILSMEEEPRILVSDQASDELAALSAFPPGLDERPVLPSFEGPETYSDVMSAVEEHSMPTHLVGWRQDVYVVSRYAKPEGTEWYVTRIDPTADEVVAHARLDTSAHHLVVAPGPREWAFIEKGPVVGFGDQEIGSMLLVPASTMAGFDGGTVCSGFGR